jgi:hypothetical protein
LAFVQSVVTISQRSYVPCFGRACSPSRENRCRSDQRRTLRVAAGWRHRARQRQQAQARHNQLLRRRGSITSADSIVEPMRSAAHRPEVDYRRSVSEHRGSIGAHSQQWHLSPQRSATRHSPEIRDQRRSAEFRRSTPETGRRSDMNHQNGRPEPQGTFETRRQRLSTRQPVRGRGAQRLVGQQGHQLPLARQQTRTNYRVSTATYCR